MMMLELHKLSAKFAYLFLFLSNLDRDSSKDVDTKDFEAALSLKLDKYFKDNCALEIANVESAKSKISDLEPECSDLNFRPEARERGMASAPRHPISRIKAILEPVDYDVSKLSDAQIYRCASYMWELSFNGGANTLNPNYIGGDSSNKVDSHKPIKYAPNTCFTKHKVTWSDGSGLSVKPLRKARTFSLAACAWDIMTYPLEGEEISVSLDKTMSLFNQKYALNKEIKELQKTLDGGGLDDEEAAAREKLHAQLRAELASIDVSSAEARKQAAQANLDAAKVATASYLQSHPMTRLADAARYEYEQLKSANAPLANKASKYRSAVIEINDCMRTMERVVQEATAALQASWN